MGTAVTLIAVKIIGLDKAVRRRRHAKTVCMGSAATPIVMRSMALNKAMAQQRHRATMRQTSDTAVTLIVMWSMAHVVTLIVVLSMALGTAAVVATTEQKMVACCSCRGEI